MPQNLSYSLLSCLLVLAACAHGGEAASGAPDPGATPHAPLLSVPARAETTPTVTDGANDPAIWIDASAPADSFILGSAAAGGIEIYKLSGERTGFMRERPIGLVEVAYDFPLPGGPGQLVVAYDTARAELLAYRLHEGGTGLTQVMSEPVSLGVEAEGLCLYHSRLTGKFFAFAAGGGLIQQWGLHGTGDDVAARHVRTIPVGLGAAQCVVDDRTGTLYYAQETVGVWAMPAEPETEAVAAPIELAQPLGRISGDTKGLAIIALDPSDGYLLVSDADESLIRVYDLATRGHVGAFVVGAGEAADAVEEAEGLAATSRSLGTAYEHGLLVLSDDDNQGEYTNYKLVAWDAISGGLSLPGGVPHDPTRAVPPTATVVMPRVETQPVSSFGDAADDPAIWIHPEQPGLSLVIGTQKQKGLNVYDMQGRLLQSLPDGRLNNVDVRYGFPLGDGSVDLVVASNRTTDSISIYRVDLATRRLVDIADGLIPTGMMDPYGLCLYQDRSDNTLYVFVNDTDGVVHQWRLEATERRRVAAHRVRTLRLDSQTEGCVADDEAGYLYIGEEDVGIWKYRAHPDGGDGRSLVDSVSEGNLTADVEGLTLYHGPDGSGYLIASNQGADNYAVYDRQGDNAFLGHFHVVADDEKGIDGASETDGLDVSSASMGDDFPHGALVVQDGRNISPADRQNFKYVPWEAIAAALGLEVHSGYDPRER